ncbi:MAG: cysteine dioxygenase family protein [Rubrobacteraceae bacterium]|uniref:cysteine dioxygenase family protein n=1 Tax=Rubrobacter naiadicus TaxID=1392641 RepID=UPI002360A4DC|nr:cysteine dioxygenase family protein [Rubrobacter naiadicus]MBX6763681.1 cysteine dioxygenase family protein [Rubrobacteraceae bacterium]MCL6439622.1 cysteine dioxygenase family protein [Rubrobacteraceae bacterium]
MGREDEFLLEHPLVRDFVGRVREDIERSEAPEEAIERMRPAFAELLAAEGWLPEEFCSAAVESGMGGGIGQWLIFRSAARDLCLFSLVVPPGSSTPVHDHLSWGLVGLYAGEQEEVVYARKDEGRPVGEREELEVVLRRRLRPGDFYPLLPPRDDIHGVRTVSEVPSVSIHLLAADTGCVWRHSYDPETGVVSPFRSGYVNRPCEEDAPPEGGGS